MVELMFAAIGSSFALIKMSVFGSIGLITKDDKEHISFMNFLEAFFGVGIVVSYFIFPLFIDEKNDASKSWLHVYYLLGSISSIAFVLLLLSPLDESASKVDNEEGFVGEFLKMFKLLIYPLVIAFVLCAFFYVLLEQSIMSWLPTFNKDVLKLGKILSIQMASILSASSALGRFLAGIVLKRLNWLMVLIVCLVLAGVLVYFSMPAIQTFVAGYKGNGITELKDVPLIAFVFPLIGLLLAPIYPAINSLILSSLPKPKHGMMSGLIILFSALGGSTGSVITGNIFQHYGGLTAFYFSLIPIAILIIGLLVFNRLHKRVKNVATA
jgi:fucose permease